MEKRYITGRRGEVSTERAMVDYVSKCVGGDQIQDSIDSVVKAAGDHDVANFMDRRQDEIDPHATGISEEQRQQIKMEYGDVPIYEIVIRKVGSVNGFGQYRRQK